MFKQTTLITSGKLLVTPNFVTATSGAPTIIVPTIPIAFYIITLNYLF